MSRTTPRTPTTSPATADAGPNDTVPEDDAAEYDAAADDAPEAPLNRADRRAKAKGGEPSHVGPRAVRTPAGRGARSHTKRQIS